jgi:hypothetical protein
MDDARVRGYLKDTKDMITGKPLSEVVPSMKFSLQDQRFAGHKKMLAYFLAYMFDNWSFLTRMLESATTVLHRYYNKHLDHDLDDIEFDEAVYFRYQHTNCIGVRIGEIVFIRSEFAGLNVLLSAYWVAKSLFSMITKTDLERRLCADFTRGIEMIEGCLDKRCDFVVMKVGEVFKIGQQDGIHYPIYLTKNVKAYNCRHEHVIRIGPTISSDTGSVFMGRIKIYTLPLLMCGHEFCLEVPKLVVDGIDISKVCRGTILPDYLNGRLTNDTLDLFEIRDPDEGLNKYYNMTISARGIDEDLIVRSLKLDGMEILREDVGSRTEAEESKTKIVEKSELTGDELLGLFNFGGRSFSPVDDEIEDGVGGVSRGSQKTLTKKLGEGSELMGLTPQHTGIDLQSDFGLGGMDMSLTTQKRKSGEALNNDGKLGIEFEQPSVTFESDSDVGGYGYPDDQDSHSKSESENYNDVEQSPNLGAGMPETSSKIATTSLGVLDLGSNQLGMGTSMLQGSSGIHGMFGFNFGSVVPQALPSNDPDSTENSDTDNNTIDNTDLSNEIPRSLLQSNETIELHNLGLFNPGSVQLNFESGSDSEEGGYGYPDSSNSNRSPNESERSVSLSKETLMNLPLSIGNIHFEQDDPSESINRDYEHQECDESSNPEEGSTNEEGDMIRLESGPMLKESFEINSKSGFGLKGEISNIEEIRSLIQIDVEVAVMEKTVSQIVNEYEYSYSDSDYNESDDEARFIQVATHYTFIETHQSYVVNKISNLVPIHTFLSRIWSGIDFQIKLRDLNFRANCTKLLLCLKPLVQRGVIELTRKQKTMLNHMIDEIVIFDSDGSNENSGIVDGFHVNFGPTATFTVSKTVEYLNEELYESIKKKHPRAKTCKIGDKDHIIIPNSGLGEFIQKPIDLTDFKNGRNEFKGMAYDLATFINSKIFELLL